MTQYPRELARALHLCSVHTKMYGTDIQLKPIPDEPRPGYLDPRRLEMTVKAKRQRESAPPPCPPTLEEMRAEMGFPGWNMNTVAIWTAYEEHVWNGNLVRIWVYYPRKPEGKTGRPGLVYLHGGGWIGGSPYDLEGSCRLIAERADCVVFNIDYSLAPEKPWPNGFQDCWTALCHIYKTAEKYGADPAKLAIGGDSAGGNLAAACCLKDRDEGTHMLRYAALMYPALTFAGTGIRDYRWSIEDYDICEEQRDLIDPGISIARPVDGDPERIMGVVGNMYLPEGADPRHPYISPMFAKDFKGLCKTLIVTAEFDGLRIQDELYAKMLRADGVETRVLRYKGMFHGFFEELGLVPQAEDLCQEIADDLRAL
ncbi:MAG: alpha/beta hydrolase [Oscillospiraceae bacterium]|nr:alpha/beta hydrolase fold domain-containing protein [Oscillospiraceae bacterium]MDY4192562.1 alpha/beta hydrolase [Oscillospiraceae bacterium]